MLKLDKATDKEVYFMTLSNQQKYNDDLLFFVLFD